MVHSSVTPEEDMPGPEPATAPADEWRRWSACVAGLGDDDFPSLLLEAANATVVADHLSLFRITPGLAPVLAGAASLDRRDVAADAGQLYVKSLHYRFDPNTPRVRSAGAAGDGPLITRQRAKDIADDTYRREIYDRFNLEDRVSIMGHEGPVWHVVSLYRDRATGRFTPQEEAEIAPRAPLMSKLASKHLRALQYAQAAASQWTAPTLPPISLLERMVGGLGNSLSNREIEVCARALQGKTSEAIALDLGVKESTVATLRKRAYGKLRISTLNELFALCLSKSAGGDATQA